MLNSRSVIYVYVENDRLKLISIWSGIGGVNESDNRDWNWLVLRVVLEAWIWQQKLKLISILDNTRDVKEFDDRD